MCRFWQRQVQVLRDARQNETGLIVIFTFSITFTSRVNLYSKSTSDHALIVDTIVVVADVARKQLQVFSCAVLWGCKPPLLSQLMPVRIQVHVLVSVRASRLLTLLLLLLLVLHASISVTHFFHQAI